MVSSSGRCRQRHGAQVFETSQSPIILEIHGTCISDLRTKTGYAWRRLCETLRVPPEMHACASIMGRPAHIADFAAASIRRDVPAYEIVLNMFRCVGRLRGAIIASVHGIQEHSRSVSLIHGDMRRRRSPSGEADASVKSCV